MVALTAALFLVPAGPAAARSSYCSPTGDYCVSARNKGSDVLLRIGTFSFQGRYRLCVRAPNGEATCRRFRLFETRDGIYASSKGWSRHFPNEGKGIYRVRWQYGGSNLGPRLSFLR